MQFWQCQAEERRLPKPMPKPKPAMMRHVLVHVYDLAMFSVRLQGGHLDDLQASFPKEAASLLRFFRNTHACLQASWKVDPADRSQEKKTSACVWRASRTVMTCERAHFMTCSLSSLWCWDPVVPRSCPWRTCHCPSWVLIRLFHFTVIAAVLRYLCEWSGPQLGWGHGSWTCHAMTIMYIHYF